jgi:NTE family protein
MITNLHYLIFYHINSSQSIECLEFASKNRFELFITSRNLFQSYVTAKWFIISLFLLIITITQVNAQETSEGKRPKIGVAFSGGGARGLAHIGVIKAFEELRVPIDYIAGTSMGSIIGGLYASGLSTEELQRAVVYEIDWNLALNLSDNRDILSFREKQVQQRFFQLEMGIDNKKGVTAPAGFVGEQELFMVLKRLSRNIFVDDFAKLPIPFKAVATDLNTAKSYLLEKGELATALRASMAVPFAFAPVEIDGRVLADGGIVNNIPVDIVRNMGADIVIAVDITTPLQTIDINSSFLTVTEQSLNVSLIQNALHALAQADIVIKPGIDEFTSSDFNRSAELIAKGYEIVMSKKALFQQLALSEAAYADYRATMQAKVPTTYNVVTPTFLEFVGNQRTPTVALERQLDHLLGQPLQFQEIKQAANQLMSFKEFKKVTYSVIRNKQGETGLLFQLHEKPWGPNYFRMGLNLSTSFDDKTDFLLSFRHERLNVNRFGGEWVNEIEFGTGFTLFSEFYQPLDYHKRFFLAPYFQMERRFVDVFEQQRGIAEYDLEGMRFGLDLGMNLSKNAAFRTGIVYEDVNTAIKMGNPTAAPRDSNIQEAHLVFKFGYDNLADKVFATRGMKIDLDTDIYDTSFGSESSYQRVAFYFRQHLPLHPRTTLISELTLLTLFDSNPPQYEDFSIGGFNQLAGYKEGDIGGNHALVYRFGALFDIPGLPKFGSLNTRLALLFHVGNAWDRFEDIYFDNLHFGGTLAAAWETKFGTLMMGTGYTDEGSFRYNLSFGHFF